jgi:hypothetical protein
VRERRAGRLECSVSNPQDSGKKEHTYFRFDITVISDGSHS